MLRCLADFLSWFRASRRQRLEWRAVRAAEAAERLLGYADYCRQRLTGPEADYAEDLARKMAARLQRKAARLTRRAFEEPDEE